MPQSVIRLFGRLAITVIAASSLPASGNEERAQPAIATPSSGTAIETTPRVLAPPEANRGAEPPEARSVTPGSPILSLKSADWKAKTLLPLGAVLVLILLAAGLLRRLLPSVKTRGRGPMRVVQQIHLSPKQSVALIHVGRRLVLVGVSPDRFSPLSEITDSEECARVMAWGQAGREASADFGRYVERESEAYDRAPVEPSISRGDDALRLREARGSVRDVLDRLKAMRMEAAAPPETPSR